MVVGVVGDDVDVDVGDDVVVVQEGMYGAPPVWSKPELYKETNQ